MGKTSIVGILSAVLFVAGCGRADKDISNDPRYSYLIGKQFRTKQEMLIYTQGWSKQIYIQLFESDVPKKSELKDKFPQKWHELKILGILPIGSELEITQVRKQGPGKGSFRVCYMKIKKSDNQQFVDTEVEPFSIYNAFEDPPTFDLKYIEELPPSH